MDQARSVVATTLDEKILLRSLASINAQRSPDFSYTYSFVHRMRPRLDINRPAGLLAREGFLSNVRKRPVPHEGQFKIAGYFYYYGIYYFTESGRLLPKETHAACAEKLSAILLERQEKDGSWWDYPL